MVYVFLFIKEPWVTPKTVTPKLQKNTNKSQKSKRHLIYKKQKLSKNAKKRKTPTNKQIKNKFSKKN
jgi:p-aminobenzoyl-glutamate transporter AbgT